MPPCVISLATPNEWLPALRVLLADTGAAERVHEEFLAGNHQSVVLLVAKGTTGRIHGAAMAQSLPGALGVLCPPRADSPELADLLATAVCDWLGDHGVKVCQAFTSTDEVAELVPLERAGFRHVTQAMFMRRELAPRPPFVQPPPSFSFTLEPRPLSAEFCTTLLATYSASRDCPELNGTRTADELLAGLTDATPGTRFYLANAGDETVGVVMLAPGTDPTVVELAYVGVVAAHRGRGVGRDLLRFALTEATGSRSSAMTLSVDARNEPALRLYRRHGFVETHRRKVWLAHVLPASRPCPGLG